jgi:hypothetical protein
MYKFVKKLVLFILLTSVFINLLIILEGKKDGLEMYSIKNNLIRDSSVLNVPRILIGGGSCALFSVDTEKLEQSTNFACYNTAIYAGIGYNLILENLLTVSKPSDKIILVPEYTTFLHSLDGTNGLCNVFFCNPTLIFDFKSYGQVENILENYPNFTKKKMSLLTKNPYNYFMETITPLKTTSKGDLLFKDYPNTVHPKLLDSIKDLSQTRNLQKSAQDFSKVIDLLNYYKEKFHSQRTDFFILWPPVMKEFHDFNYNEITKIKSLVDNKLSVQCINEFCGLILRKEYFHDTPEHLNNIGKKVWFEEIKGKLSIL